MTALTTIHAPATPAPLPALPIRIRPGTILDIPFMDELQKKHTRQVGWMPTKQFEGKIAAGHVLVAEGVAGCELLVASEGTASPATSNQQPTTRLGYLIGNDQYFKRDDVGIIYQINVAPVAQRGLIGATLLKAQFERSAWGCKLYCCWCAQDIAANHFWKAMGFVPLAFRTGSAKKDRVHIFWQKRIRAGDEETPWWFPSQTTGGSIREDRIVLPIPTGVQWCDEMPRILPGDADASSSDRAELPSPSDVSRPALSGSKPRPKRLANPPEGETTEPAPIGLSRLSFVPSTPTPATKPKATRPRAEPKRPKKNDARLVSAARELRDRWLEAVNRGEFVALPEAKYEVARVIESSPQTALLPAA